MIYFQHDVQSLYSLLFTLTTLKPSQVSVPSVPSTHIICVFPSVEFLPMEKSTVCVSPSTAPRIWKAKSVFSLTRVSEHPHIHHLVILLFCNPCWPALFPLVLISRQRTEGQLSFSLFLCPLYFNSASTGSTRQVLLIINWLIGPELEVLVLLVKLTHNSLGK